MKGLYIFTKELLFVQITQKSNIKHSRGVDGSRSYIVLKCILYMYMIY